MKTRTKEKLEVLVTLPLSAAHKVLFESAAPQAHFQYMPLQAVTREVALTAHVVVGNVPPALLAGSENLAWLQLHSAGTNGYTDGVLPEGTLLTNATGAYGLAISEHMLGMVLMLTKKLHLYLHNQQKTQWRDEGPVGGLYGANVLVVGLGDIGLNFAGRCHAMGSRVTGIRRVPRDVPAGVDEVYGLEEIDRLLSQADVVALSLPATPSTFRLFDAARIARMKPGAILINVGRGTAICQDALCEALESGHLGGAGLDVTDPEPLPPEHRLWHAPNVLITPHVSGGYHFPETLERIVRLSADNLAAFMQNRPMTSVVDFQTGYRKI